MILIDSSSSSWSSSSWRQTGFIHSWGILCCHALPSNATLWFQPPSRWCLKHPRVCTYHIYICRYMRKSNYHMYNYIVVYVCACNKRKHIIFVNLSIDLRTLGVSFQRLCIDAYLCPMLAGLLVSSQRFAKRFHTSSGHTKEQYCGSVDFCEDNLFITYNS